MINYTDSFGRDVVLESLPSIHNKRIGFIIRRERQSLYESWDLETAKKVLEELEKTIQILESIG